jgi:S-adenosylmethionine:tRNA ribosyltransferase-isomerase
MNLADFSYHLPIEQIAQEPAHPRDHAKLMLINRTTKQISHHHIYDLPSLLPSDYFIIANNTKVFPARIMGQKPTGGKVEILLTAPLGHSRYLCIAKPGLKIGDHINFEAGLEGVIMAVNDMERTIRFNQEESHLRTTLSRIGTMPTPPYIKKLLGNSSDYQTIYAKYGFSAAAPTAGLHFTSELLNTIKQHHSWQELTLNVGLGTFLPVKSNKVEEHHMHAESYNLSRSTADQIKSLKLNGQKLLSIGTTTMRALESNPHLVPGPGSTSIFIYPPYRFRLTNALLTNFHLPSSTLLMLVSAFCTYPNSPEQFTDFNHSLLGHAYAEAINNNYRFFSFGDAMLII